MTESIFDAIGHNFLVGAPSDSSKSEIKSLRKKIQIPIAGFYNYKKTEDQLRSSIL